MASAQITRINRPPSPIAWLNANPETLYIPEHVVSFSIYWAHGVLYTVNLRFIFSGYIYILYRGFTNLHESFFII